VTTTGPVSIQYPQVTTNLSPDHTLAHLIVMVEAQNHLDTEIEVSVSATLQNIGTVAQKVTLGPRETKTIIFTPASYPVLNVKSPNLVCFVLLAFIFV
jgi:exo-1,4-beta-D-glucosaminidase